jgi:hypothetical protein
MLVITSIALKGEGEREKKKSHIIKKPSSVDIIYYSFHQYIQAAL